MMKNFTQNIGKTLPMLFYFLTLSIVINAQSYSYDINFYQNAGNPGGLNTETDNTITGWTQIIGGSQSSNIWSPTVTIPFSFNFFGTPVTSFKVSQNGLLTFDVATTLLPNANTNLPNSGVPNMTVAAMWDEFTNAPPTGSNDVIYYKVFGSAPNRQLWVKWFSFEYGNPNTSFAYFSAVLEETSNKVYVVDMYQTTPALTTTVGLQENSTNAVQFGSNNIAQESSNSTPASDNDFWEFIPRLLLANNAGIADLISPSAAFNPGTQNVEVELFNYGTNSLTSVDILWSVNGTSQTTYSWTGTLAPNTGTNVLLGTFAFPAGSSVVSAWTNNPNGVADPNTADDSLTVTVCTALPAGTYTVGGAGANYSNLSAAVNDLNNCGVAGPVIFNVLPGIYNEQLIISQIPGSSATNTITINGNGQELQFTGTASNLAAITLDGADWVTIDSFEIIALDPTYGYGILLTNEADNNTILNNVIDLSAVTSTTAANSSGIVASGTYTNNSTSGDNATNLVIEGNEIIGGYNGIRINGEVGTPSTGIVMRDNIIRDFYFYGIYISDLNGALIEGNDIHRENRVLVSSFYGIYSAAGNINLDINSNRIHDSHTSASSQSGLAYGISFVSTDAPVGSENIVYNNAIYNFNSLTGTQYGIYNSSSDGTWFYHNTIILDNTGSTSGITRGFYQLTAATNIEFKNNIVEVTRGGSGAKYAIYYGTITSTIASDYNVLYANSSAGTVGVGYYSSTQATLADWQLASGDDLNSSEADPVLSNPLIGNIMPISSNIDNIGTPLGILFDIYNNPRSPSLPDVGAVEFTGLAEDIALLQARLTTGQCLSNNDSLYFTIENVIGGAVDFSTDPLTAVWSVSGPMSSTGTIVINSGTLAAGASLEVGGAGVDLSQPGNYNLNVYIQPNATNLSALNDTLGIPATINILPLISATPEADTVETTFGTVSLLAISPLMPTDTFFITEVAHYKFTTGEPVGGWPAYLIADDYIEITGAPGSDLGGITLEQWDGSSMLSSYTFPYGTYLSPNGTAIIAVGQLGSSVESPADFYYHGTGSFTGSFSSGGNNGRILKDLSGNIIDAVGVGTTYTFPTASGVTTADWSGNSGNHSSTSGVRLTGPDLNNASNWIVSNISPQDPNVLNANVPLPAPVIISGFQWLYQGNPIGTSTQITVGPYTVSGIYEYVANYNSPCGVVSDTVTITVILPSCPPPFALGATATGPNSADLTWTGGGATNWNIEYGPAGFAQGSGTLVNTNTIPYSLSGLSSNLLYQFYVRDSCAVGDVSTWAGPLSFSGELTPCDDFEGYATGLAGPQSILINEWAGAGGDAVISTDYANSGTNSLKIHTSGTNAFSDVVAEVGVYDTGMWNVAFDLYVPATFGGYYNILHNYQGTGTNVWAIEVTLDANGTATVEEGTNGSNTIGTYNYNVGAWNRVEHFIDLNNDTAWIEVNGMPTNVGWQFSLGNLANFGGQFNAVNFYSTAPTGQTPLIYFDDFCITQYIPTMDDIALTAILSPLGPCGDSSSAVIVQLVNQGLNPQSNIPVVVQYDNGTIGTLTGTYTGTIQANQTVSFTVGTINTYAGGTFDMTAYTMLIGDEDLLNDTSYVTVSFDAISEPSTQFGSQCVNIGDAVQVIADDLSLNYIWYNASGSVIGSGDTLSLTVTADMEIYAEAINPNANACASPRRFMAEVNIIPVPTITPEPAACFAEPSRTLQASISGGTWSGAGITNPTAGTFNPGIAGLGTHQIIYQVTGMNGCVGSDTIDIIVNSNPNATIAGPRNVCVNGNIIDFDAPSPGGVWSGTGITNTTTGLFNPSIAGAGTYTITYNINIVGCVAIDTHVIQVNALPNASITAPAQACINTSPVTLTAATAGGTWTGVGVNATGVFNPSLAGAGTHKVYYQVTSANGCMGMDSATIVVNALPNASFTAPTQICVNASPVSITPASTGGTWTGVGINASGMFDPAVTGSGNHKIYYQITSANGCSAMDSATIVVNPLPNATITGPAQICVNTAPVAITPTIAGGTFSGTGITNVTNGTFDPSVAGVGTTKVYYSVTSSAGCTNMDSITIIVNPLPDATITSTTDPLCFDAAPLQLNAATTGGAWSGTGINATGMFDASVSGAGTFTITYSVTDNNGCSASATSNITVTTEVVAITDSIVPTYNPAASNGEIYISVNGGTSPYTYEWSNGAITKDISGLTDGTYTVTITDANGCEKEYTYIVPFIFGTGIQVVDLLKAVEVYPNPSSGIINIHIKNGIDADVSFEVFDVVGKQILSRTESVSGNHQERIDLARYASGTYMIKITVNGESISKKVVLTK